MLIGLGWAGRVRAGEGQWCIMVYGAAEACFFFLCVCVLVQAIDERICHSKK